MKINLFIWKLINFSDFFFLIHFKTFTWRLFSIMYVFCNCLINEMLVYFSLQHYGHDRDRRYVRRSPPPTGQYQTCNIICGLRAFVGAIRACPFSDHNMTVRRLNCRAFAMNHDLIYQTALSSWVLLTNIWTLKLKWWWKVKHTNPIVCHVSRTLDYNPSSFERGGVRWF